MWFEIKCNPKRKNAPKNLWRTIYLSRYLKEDLKYIVESTIQRNGFFAHPENLLVAMLADDRQHVRELALRRIISTRAKSLPQKEVRKFTIPVINFTAEIISISSRGRPLTIPSHL